MLLRLRSRCAAPAVLLAVLLAAGCTKPVRQDRSIVFAPDGKAVVFEHGANGVFITDPATGKPKQIYQPGPDILATSPPLWDAAGKRLIFTTARADDGRPPAPPAEPPATGALFLPRRAVYTCWLYDPAGG